MCLVMQHTRLSCFDEESQLNGLWSHTGLSNRCHRSPSLITPIHHHKGIEVRVEFLERIFISTSLSGVLGEEVRVHCQVERAESSQGFGGGDVTSGRESSLLVAQVSVQSIVVDWTLKL